MKTQKLTPKDRKEIVRRVKSGEKQKVLVQEYGVSSSLISRVISQAKKLDDTPVFKPVDLSNLTTSQLHNRYKDCHRQLMNLYDEVVVRTEEATVLRDRIKSEGAKPSAQRDNDWLQAQQRRLVWCEDHRALSFDMANLYQEIASVLHAIRKRKAPIPYTSAISAFLHRSGV